MILAHHFAVLASFSWDCMRWKWIFPAQCLKDTECSINSNPLNIFEILVCGGRICVGLGVRGQEGWEQSWKTDPWSLHKAQQVTTVGTSRHFGTGCVCDCRLSPDVCRQGNPVTANTRQRPMWPLCMSLGCFLRTVTFCDSLPPPLCSLASGMCLSWQRAWIVTWEMKMTLGESLLTLLNIWTVLTTRLSCSRAAQAFRGSKKLSAPKTFVHLIQGFYLFSICSRQPVLQRP